MEFLVSEGISEGTLPFSLKIFDKKFDPSQLLENAPALLQITTKIILL